MAANVVDIEMLERGLQRPLHFERRARANGVGHVHALHANLLHQACQVRHAAGRHIALVRATHGATHGAAHRNARRQRGLHHRGKTLDAFFDGTVDVFLTERLAGGCKHHDLIGLTGDGRGIALCIRREHRVTHTRFALDARHHLGVVGHLWHPLGADETGDLDLGQTCGLQTVHQLDLDGRRHGLLFVLQAVAGTDVDDLNA